MADGTADISPGTCPGCGARYEGGQASAPDSVRTALAAFGADTLDAMAVTSALFACTPAESAARGVAITSDQRDGFYCWWLFAREEGDCDVVATLGLLDSR